MLLKLYGLIGAFLFMVSCGKKIDCDEFEKRVYSCRENFAKRLTPGKKTNDKKFKTLLEEKVVKSCNSRGGKVGDASKIKRCLAKSGCEGFVNCILGIKEVPKK